jgi:alkylated DNA repair dioxygenase AlkB
MQSKMHSQRDFFATDSEPDLETEDFAYIPGFLAGQQASDWFDELYAQVDWQQDEVNVFGKRHRIPRLHQWYGDPDAAYRWSGLEMQPRSWIEPLLAIRDLVSDYCRSDFNSVLLNLYRDGNDSMGWHSDDEPELGAYPTLAFVSLGAARDLHLRRKDGSTGTRSLRLEHGSLLIMSGSSQHDWQHALPKRKRVGEPRISLTFRQVVTPAAVR